MSDYQYFRVRLLEQIDSELPEPGYSVILPVAEHRAVVFAWRVTPRDKRLVVLSRASADYPSASRLKLEKLDPAKLGVPVGPKGDLGQVETPSPYKDLPIQEFMRLRDVFHADYAKLFEDYVGGRPIAPAVARSVEERMPVFEKPPIMPLFRVTAPAFFARLDALSKKA